MDSLPAAEVAREIGTTPATLRRWVDRGLIPQFHGAWTPSAVAHVRVVARMRERGHSLDEIRDGSWNLDIMGSLWSELPSHEVIAEPGEVSGWRYPPRAVRAAAAQAYLADGCSWLSKEAARVLGRPLPR